MKIYTFNLQTYKQFGTIQNILLISKSSDPFEANTLLVYSDSFAIFLT